MGELKAAVIHRYGKLWSLVNTQTCVSFQTQSPLKWVGVLSPLEEN